MTQCPSQHTIRTRHGEFANMKRDLLDILACPLCKGPLTVTVKEEDAAEIITGELHCARCPEP